MKQWLKDAVFYEIYPQSFYDTNGDGIGDLKGIIEKLDYIKELGCNALWINPCFDSPFKDAGYDVRDYKLIAPRYGTNADAKALFEAAHTKGIHVLLDLVPGHTSEEHAWFKESSKPEKNEYSDRYIWTDSCFSAGDGMPFIGGETDRNGTYIFELLQVPACFELWLRQVPRKVANAHRCPWPARNGGSREGCDALLAGYGLRWFPCGYGIQPGQE